MQLKDIGEKRLIEHIADMFGKPSPRVLKGIGDDTSVTLCANGSDGKCLLATTDTLAQGVHFTLATTGALALGRKLVSVSLSDVAAMGATPLFLLLSLSMPQQTDEDFFNSLHDGIKERCDEFNVALIGGNTTASKSDIILTGTVLGEADKDRVIYRGGARPGDDIYVTGTLGDSALGLEVLTGAGTKQAADKVDNGRFKRQIKKHTDPEPRVIAGALLSKRSIANAMTDLSDGLATDLETLCRESRVRAEVKSDDITLSNELREYIKVHPEARCLPLTGAEDYELLFTANKEKHKLVTELFGELKLQVTRIGSIKGEEVTSGVKSGTSSGVKFGVKFIDNNNEEIILLKKGYEHFK